MLSYFIRLLGLFPSPPWYCTIDCSTRSNY